MSIEFNDEENGKGLVQFYEEEIGANPGDISNSPSKLKKFAARVNLALDKYFSIAIPASGTWELDDSNHEDYAVIYANITSGRRDYKFTEDETGNLILDIYKVLILPSATATTYVEIDGVNENLSENSDLIDESNSAGVPNVYFKRANAIHLGGAVPNYNATRGIKVLINRESSYFNFEDTTKKPGYPYHQEYFFLKPALDHARRNTLAVLPRLEKAVLDLEGDPLTDTPGLIAKAYSRREKDVRNVMTTKKIRYI